ncbi:50S ribosome-binding GTPase [Polaribacter litorisediminis]|uniref:GTPase n=1 Tax=Polaribacter litorisediminis TaxID=1908341 RepID=UPI001CBE542F|nr:GTPase [Polaribacter litorisediminis]UAM98012.1 50S ribosome-binding GTPase [Polaribacter litorisediminis]
MSIENPKKEKKLVNKVEILSNAEKAFEKMTNVLLDLKPPETIYTSRNEDNFFNELKAFVKLEIENIKKITHHLKENVEWAQLNAAFFGETNAGKSTTIESLLSYLDVPRNGKTIGDGSKDFTKEVTYHNFNSNGKKIGLIDLPGIEGDEQGNLDDIDAKLRRGITKAHVVFYVYGNSKKPEPATVKKINKYLNEQATVISICNNRGKAAKYKRILNKEGKVALKASEVNEQSKEILKEVLGKQYNGDLFINSLAAYLSVGEIERDDFKADKKAFLEVFKTEDKLRTFSNLNSIIDTIEIKSKNEESVILEANKQKLNRVLREVATNLSDFKQIEISEEKIEKTRIEIEEFFKTVKSDIKLYQTKCKNSLEISIDNHFRKLQTEIFRMIDDGNVKEEKVKILVEYQSKRLQTTLVKSLKYYNSSLIIRIEDRLKKLERYSKVNINQLFSNTVQIGNINLEGLTELDVSFADIAGFAAAFGGFVFGPWGGAISLARWGISKLFFGDGGKAKAKAKISNELRIKRDKLKEEFRNQIIKKQYDSIEAEVFQRFKQLNDVPNEMLDWREKINNSLKEIESLIIN